MPEANKASNSGKSSLKRRDFLKTGVAGAAALALPVAEAATPTSESGEGHVLLPAPPPESDPPPTTEFQTFERTGSDFMTDVIKTLPLEYMCANPADLFAACHESLTGPYGGNQNPEWITCTDEEIGVAMGHGYYKIEGRPIITSGHSTVGLMHAAMAIYNAYCDRVPVYMIFGDDQAPSNHAVLDASAPVRDYIRWYDRPMTLAAFAESAVRAYAFAVTPPTMPVLLAVDYSLQQLPIKGPDARIPKLSIPVPAEADSGSIAETAKLLAQAKNPVLICDRYSRSQEGIDSLVELAELLQAPVIDRGGRMNFPKRHPLNQSFYSETREFIQQADMILGLEANMSIVGQSQAKTISIGADDAFTRGNYQEIGHYGPVDISLAGDAQASLPKLIEAVKQQIGSNQRVAAQARKAKLADISRQTFEQARVAQTYAWEGVPISTARMCAEVWEAIKNEDWSFVSEDLHFGRWPTRLWPMEKSYHYNGGPGGGGQGYNAPSSLGAALANKKHGRLTIDIQCDGDLMYNPGVLWTAAHHKIPILYMMHNNRAYHAEVMYLQRSADLHNHPLPKGGIGVRLDDPPLDFARIAGGMGVYAEGPITDPRELGPALQRAVAIVKKGEPALVDVITQPR